MFASLQNPYVEILTHNVMVVGDGVWRWKYSCLDEVSRVGLHNEISALIRKESGVPTVSLFTMW